MNAQELAALNPFPGLRAFAPAESDLFFGREEQIAALVARVGAEPFVAVAGASGCGKSSLVLAGLLRALKARDGKRWRPVVLRPGRQPIVHLAEPLAVALGRGGSPGEVGALYGRLRLSAAGLVEEVGRAALPAGETVLVIVDQFEELFRYERMSDPEEAAAFVKLLLQAAQDAASPVRVVITLRSEALGHCADFAGLAEAVSRGQVLVPKLTRDQRKLAIVAPVQLRGFQIRPSLVQRILNDVPDDFDDLPVMQHALSRTWDYWAVHSAGPGCEAGARDIEITDYDAVGGSAAALDRHGDEVLESLGPARRGVVVHVMRALTERRPDGIELRRPLPFDQLCAVVGGDRVDVAAVVDRLRAEGTSFVRPPPTEPLEHNPVVDITHESLIRQWRALREWVKDEAESRAELEALLGAAKRERTRAGGRDGELLQGATLASAVEWRERERPTDEWVKLVAGDPGAAAWTDARQFLQDSVDGATRLRIRTALVRFLLGLAVLVTLIALAMFARARFSEHEQSRQRISNRLANVGWLELRLDPALSAQFAVASLEHDPDNGLAQRLLRQSVESLLVAHTEQLYDLGVPIVDARPNRAGTRIVVLGEDRLVIVDAADAKPVAEPRSLPWRAKNAWLLDERGIVVLQSESEGVHVQGVDGRPLLEWNCDGRTDDHVYAVEVSADGRWLAAGCLTGRLALWALPQRAEAPAPPRVLSAGGGATVTALAFAPSGAWLASGDADGQALLWNLARPDGPWIGRVGSKRIESPMNHKEAIRDVDIWQGDDRLLVATSSDDRTAIIWQVDPTRPQLMQEGKDRKARWTLPHERPVVRGRFERSSKLMTTVDKQLLFWTNEKHEPSNARHNGWIVDAEVSPGGDYAVSASDDGSVRVWSRQLGAVAVLRGHRDTVVRSRFIGEKRIVTASRDGTLRIWTIDPVQTLQFAPGRWMTSVAPSPEGRDLAFCTEDRDKGGCAILPLADDPAGKSTDTVTLKRPSQRTDMITRLFWDAKGTGLRATGTDYDTFSRYRSLRWQPSSGQWVIEKGDQLAYGYSAARGETLFVDSTGAVRVRPDADADGAASAPLFTLPSKFYPQVAALSDDGHWIAAADGSKILLFKRSAPVQPPREFAGHQGAVLALAFSPDNRRLASASSDRTARLWPVDPAVAPVELAGGHTGAIYTLAFNHRGDQLVTGSADGTLRVWDTHSGEEVVALEWHADTVNDLRFHPRDDTLFTASDDGAVKRGKCRTCAMSLDELRKLVITSGLARLTNPDRDRIEQEGRHAAARSRR